eukprot:476154_1
MARKLIIDKSEFSTGDTIEVYRNIGSIGRKWRIEKIVDIHSNNTHIKTEYFDLKNNRQYQSKWINKITQKKYISPPNCHCINYIPLTPLRISIYHRAPNICYSINKDSLLTMANTGNCNIHGYNMSTNTWTSYNKVHDHELDCFRASKIKLPKRIGLSVFI